MAGESETLLSPGSISRKSRAKPDDSRQKGVETPSAMSKLTFLN
jgi:hypothetical protein